MEVEEVKKILPHRYPFLFIDRIEELEPGKRAVGIKEVSPKEFYFKGHFPGYPVMPGVLIVEALAQVGAVAFLTLPDYQGKIPLFAGIDKFRFRYRVLPGDTLRLEVEVLALRGGFGKGSASAWVKDKKVAEGTLLFGVTDR